MAASSSAALRRSSFFAILTCPVSIHIIVQFTKHRILTFSSLEKVHVHIHVQITLCCGLLLLLDVFLLLFFVLVVVLLLTVLGTRRFSSIRIASTSASLCEFLGTFFCVRFLAWARRLAVPLFFLEAAVLFFFPRYRIVRKTQGSSLIETLFLRRFCNVFFLTVTWTIILNTCEFWETRDDDDDERKNESQWLSLLLFPTLIPKTYHIIFFLY